MAKTTLGIIAKYEESKAVAPDVMLIFETGDFYELLNDDARKAARVLGLTLTSYSRKDTTVPMTGFPRHQLDAYLQKLIKYGFRVSVVEDK